VRKIIPVVAAGAPPWAWAGRISFGTPFYLPELKKYFLVEDLCEACRDGRKVARTPSTSGSTAAT
jgi:hypothetical protein